MDATCRPCETKLAQSEGNLWLLRYLKIIKKSLRNKPAAYQNIRVHTHSNCQVAWCRAASGWCGLLMAGADCRWQVRIADGRCGLPMADTHSPWRVWVIDVWHGSGRWAVCVWLLCGCWPHWSLLGSWEVWVWLLGHNWACWLLLGHCWVLFIIGLYYWHWVWSWWWLCCCGCCPHCGSFHRGSSRCLLFSRYLSF